MWRAIRGRTWIVLVPKVGGKEGGMEEWDLVEEFFNRIRDQRYLCFFNTKLCQADYFIELLNLGAGSRLVGTTAPGCTTTLMGI